jgi:N-acetylmuramoyl-L-alanine amidase
VKTIVIDPGHGGTEEGAKGPGGSLEKDATLGLAKTIAETLQRRGYRVLLTRTTDATVGLEDRAAAANAAKADVFLSIHCNASRAASAHGTEVYYLSLDASDRAAAALAESENRAPADGAAAGKNASGRDLDLILWDLAQNQHLAASARLAEIVQADFNRLLGIATRGVKQAPFRVLIGVNAPAVLVEVSFITNADEEKKLSSEEFRRQVADTLGGSLETFFKAADGAGPVPYAPKAGKS